tara:strand:+ start:233 stop:352 length:120 start_codon:yes stop_codon:yes gene_type:complete
MVDRWLVVGWIIGGKEGRKKERRIRVYLTNYYGLKVKLI